jgi:hypothetical protein
MPFHEKSAWLMGLALLAASLFYVGMVLGLSRELGQLAPPILPFVIVFTVFLTLVAIVGHILIAVLAPKEAAAAPDERERKLLALAGHRAGYVFSTGVVCGLGAYLITRDGDLLFYAVFASLIVAQLAEYAWQIWFYRTAV